MPSISCVVEVIHGGLVLFRNVLVCKTTEYGKLFLYASDSLNVV